MDGPSTSGDGDDTNSDIDVSGDGDGQVDIEGNFDVVDCGADATTTVSGTVYDPAGRLPLYNALVYVPVPGTELPPITEGVSCEKCAGREARALSAALSDSSGHFVLEDVPAGTNVPLVIEVGKWRRRVTLPEVKSCQDNALADPELTRLPRSSTEGNLPRIAMVTGHSDALECLLRKIGIDDTEFTTDSEDGRVHMYHGCIHKSSSEYGANQFSPELGGGSFSSAAATLYGNPENLDRYDMLILSCEGHSCDDEKAPFMETMKAYGDKGGRIFFDHMHFRWFVKSDHEWETIGEFDTGEDFPPNTAFSVDTSFPKGQALSEWLVAVEASEVPGQLVIAEAQRSAKSVNNPPAQRWVYNESAVQFMTVNTPIELAETAPEDQCGRLVHTDLHVSAASASNQNVPFPGGCDSGPLSPEEKTLAFILFDLSSCVQKEDAVPEPPVIVK